MNIRPCPHCGGAAELIGVYEPKKKMKLMKVICDNCGATGAEVYCICLDANGTDATACRDAINAWNMRTTQMYPHLIRARHTAIFKGKQ